MEAAVGRAIESGSTESIARYVNAQKANWARWSLGHGQITPAVELRLPIVMPKALVTIDAMSREAMGLLTMRRLKESNTAAQ